MQFKAFFRDVFIQTARNAKIVCGVVTLAKLLAGWVRTVETATYLEENALMHRVADVLLANPVTFTPLLELNTIMNPKIDVEALPANAKRIRPRR